MDARRMRSGLMLGALAFAAAACSDDEDPVDPEPEPPEELTGSALMQTLEEQQYQQNWELWSENHVLYDVCCGHEGDPPMVDLLTVYLNDEAMAAWENDTEFPEGATIVKEGYMAPEDEGGEPSLAVLTVMHKAEEGYNPEGNDWFWVQYDGGTREPMAEGRVQMCIGCHSGQDNHDLVIGPQNSNP